MICAPKKKGTKKPRFYALFIFFFSSFEFLNQSIRSCYIYLYIWLGSFGQEEIGFPESYMRVPIIGRWFIGGSLKKFISELGYIIICWVNGSPENRWAQDVTAKRFTPDDCFTQCSSAQHKRECTHIVLPQYQDMVPLYSPARPLRSAYEVGESFCPFFCYCILPDRRTRVALYLRDLTLDVPSERSCIGNIWISENLSIINSVYLSRFKRKNTHTHTHTCLTESLSNRKR
jgi:hypothetical protein